MSQATQDLALSNPVKRQKTKIKIAMLGCGTVGSGLMQILENFQDKIELSKILVRNEQRAKEISTQVKFPLEKFTWTIEDIINDTETDIVVELMGGVEHTKEILLKVIAAGKDIVTANKDLLALEGESLFEAAKKQGSNILFEAAVAGGIPIISTLKQSLKGNHISYIQGIINGTTNYILGLMEYEGMSFADALKQAQDKGFAEADPTNDVEGYDAAYKTAILASIISGKRVDVKKVFCEGISKISIEDINSAKKRGYKIKLLGMINNPKEPNKKLDARVHPVFVPLDNPLASINLETNAVLIKGDAVQELTISGKGAGSLPTASAVSGDLLMLVESKLGNKEDGRQELEQYVCTHSSYAELKDIAEVKNSFYVRISMLDSVGVLRDLGEITSKNKANVKFIDQYDVQGEQARADFILDPLAESDMNRIIDELKSINSIKEIESVIRVLA